jgi:uncharacterized protein (UPF0332 family)
MFHEAEALLNEKQVRFGKHSAVHAADGEHFAKTKALAAIERKQATRFGCCF